MAILIDGDGKSRQVSREELDAAEDGTVEHLGAGIYRVKIEPTYKTKVMKPKKD